MIVTKQFGFTATEFFKLLVILFLEKRWWILALFWVPALFHVFEGFSQDSLFSLFLAVLCTVLVTAQLWKHSHSKENGNLLKRIYYQIDEEKMTGYIEGGSEGNIMIADFIKVKQTKKYYLLYHSKNNFTFIPKDAFKSPADERWFRNNIIRQIAG